MNACELEIDLFCRGLRVPPRVSLEGTRGVGDAAAGLGSGLEIVIPTGSRLKPRIWMNAPVDDRFVKSSPYELAGAPGAYRVHDQRDGLEYPVDLPMRPTWQYRQTSRDVPMSRIGSMQGTVLQIYVHPACAFWDTNQHCLYCTTAQGIRHSDIAPRTVEDVVETCWAARAAGVTCVQLNGGFQGAHGLEFVEPFVRAIKEEVGLLVSVQLAPERRFEGYRRLLDAGADAFSFCIDLLDASWFSRICPGKARTLGQPIFFKAMEYCAARLPRAAVSGQVIAGLEPVPNTIEAIQRIVAAGALPSVCIFRPTRGSNMEDWPSPRFEEMREVMTATYDACRRARLPIGVAPNVEWSLVVTPEDAALLAPRTSAFYRYELWRRAARLASRPRYGARLRPQSRRIPVETPHDLGGPPGA